ncbi:MAG: GNAT family N-acetyltransferase [Pseudomonadota bacterium]
MTPRNQPLTFQEFSPQAAWLGQQLGIAIWSERLHWSGLEMVDDELMTRTRSSVAHRAFYNVLSTRLRRSKLESDVDRCLAILGAETQASRWFLNAQTYESEITEHLVGRGYESFASVSIMATNVANNQKHAWCEMQSDVCDYVSAIENAQQLNDCCQVITQTGDFSSDFAEAWLDMMLACGFSKTDPWRIYACDIDGVTAGALCALWTDQVVLIEALSVLHAYRRKNVGSALLFRALADARRAGYQVVMAYPMAGAKQIYDRYEFGDFGSIDCVTVGEQETTVMEEANPTFTPPKPFEHDRQDLRQPTRQ